MYQLNPTEKEFDLRNAIALANFATLAYKGEAIIKATLSEYSCHYIFDNKNGFDTDLFVAGNKEAIVVFFRGTHSVEDWVSNVDNRLQAVLMGHVRRGYWDTIQPIWASLLETIGILKNNNQPVFLAGHSQGGALAMITARRLFDVGLVAQGVYTYGQPKVGDMLFASSYDSLLKECTFRIFNEEDPIISLPTKLYHAGVGVMLGEGGSLQINLESNLLETSGGGFAAILDSLFEYASNNMKYHQMETYIKRLFDFLS